MNLSLGAVSAGWPVTLETVTVWLDVMGRAAWQGGVAIALVWVVCRVLPRLRPQTRCWLWRLAYARVLASLLVTTPIALPLLKPAAPLAPPSAAGSASDPARPTRPAEAGTEGPAANTARPAPVAAEDLHRPPAAREIGVVLLFLVWVAGVIWSLVRLAGEWSAAEWVRSLSEPVRDQGLVDRLWELCLRFGLRENPRLLVMPGAGSPVLLGVRKPSVVVTSALLEQFSPDELELMLAHEVAHLKRRDLAWGWLAALGQALFFFHPLVWLAGREWKTAHEMACDELTVAVTRAPVAKYGQVLVKVAAQCRPSLHSRLATAGVMESPDVLKQRLTAMKRLVRSPYNGACAAWTLGLLAVLGVVPWRLTSRVLAQEAPAQRSNGAPAPHATHSTPAGADGAAHARTGVSPPTDRAAQLREPGVPLPPPEVAPSFPQVPATGGPDGIRKGAQHLPGEIQSLAPLGFGPGVWPARPSGFPDPALAIPRRSGSSAAPAPADDPERALTDLRGAAPGQRLGILNRLAGMKADGRRSIVARAVEPLLNDRDLFIRAAAARVLGSWGREESVPLLIGRLDDSEHAVRWAVLESLGKLHDRRAAEPLAHMLASRDCAFAGRALRELGPAAAPAVLPALSDPEWTVRLEACRVLEATGSPAEVASLRSALRDTNGLVARAAESALRVIEARSGHKPTSSN